MSYLVLTESQDENMQFLFILVNSLIFLKQAYLVKEIARKGKKHIIMFTTCAVKWV